MTKMGLDLRQIVLPVFFGLFLMASWSRAEISETCVQELMKFPGPKTEKYIQSACRRVQVEPSCKSVEDRPIFHYDQESRREHSKKILVLSLIHGDEKPAGSVGRYWMERLESIEPRNSWRVLPLVNPDGYIKGTRTNGRKIDLNRNFPTKDWTELAVQYWKTKTSSNPRRFPGETPGSEPEVQCVLHHIEQYKPDFIVSIHTPLKVLDFDGPKKMKPPVVSFLPWKSLGHYPGSLGRYMWFERSVPVLTMEMDGELPKNYTPYEKLQDVIGTLVRLEAE